MRGSKSTNSPWNSTCDPDQIVRNAATYSSVRAPRPIKDARAAPRYEPNEGSVATRRSTSVNGGLCRVAKPTAMVLTRQKTPLLERDKAAFDAIGRGGYVLREEAGSLELILLATGSEVGLAVAVAEKLNARGTGTRVVSMPSTDVFLAQDSDYQEWVLPAECRARVAIEAGHPDYWYRFVGLDGAVVGIERFGLSAPVSTPARR